MDTVVFNNGSFFMALIVGVLLALSFQVVLAMLSAACGVSLMGNVEEKFNEHAQHSAAHEKKGNPLLRVINGIGLWTLITASVSLFFASMLAVKVSMIDSNQINLTLGLSIWAAVFLIMIYLETKMAGAFLGGIAHTFFNGVRQSARIVKGIFGKSPVEKTADSIRKEIVHTLHDPQLTSAVKGYMHKFQVPAFDWHQARKELTKLFSDLELKAVTRDEEGEKETFIQLAKKHPHFSKTDLNKLAEIFDEVKSGMKQEGTPADKAMTTIGNMVSGSTSADDAREVRQKVETYLKNIGVEALNPESLKNDLNKIINDPKSARSVVLNRIKQFDHPTLVSIVTQKANMSQEQAEKVVGKVESVFQSIKEKVSMGTGPQGRGIKDALEDKFRNYFASLQRPEFNYDRIKYDFEEMLHDPKASLEILKSRFKTFDRESLIALISSRPNISKEQAENIVSKIEEAKNSVLRKAERVENAIIEKAQEAKRMAIHQAENARQCMVLSAWWIFATAVVSALTAALGGIVAL